MSRAPLVAIALTSGLFAVAVGGPSRSDGAHAASGRRHEIRMRAVSFSPRTLAVQLGDTVVWRNADIVRHNAMSGELIASGDLATGEEFAWVPTDTGLVSYRCTIHQRMRGEVRVRE